MVIFYQFIYLTIGVFASRRVSKQNTFHVFFIQWVNEWKIKLNSLFKANTIAWDECIIAHLKKGVEALDRTFQDISYCNWFMGGITVLLTRDFRQIFIVVSRGTRAHQVQSCLKSSFLWLKVNVMYSKVNVRTFSLIFYITVSCLTILFYEIYTKKKCLNFILSYIQKQLQSTFFYEKHQIIQLLINKNN